VTVDNLVLQFIDNLADRTHSVIFYEDLKHGRVIQNRYMKVGLLNGEKCVITTHEDDAELIEKEMADFGIDVKHHKKANLLQIVKIRDPREHPEGLVAGIEDLRRQLWTEPSTSSDIY